MEKITVTNRLFDKVNINIHKNLGLLVGKNNSGKSILLKSIHQGLLGKNSTKFKVDDIPVSYGDYQVVYLKEIFELQNEIKITKTNPLRDELLKFINTNMDTNEKYHDFQMKLSGLSEDFGSLITSYLTFDNQEDEFLQNIRFKSQVSFQTIEILLDKLLKIDVLDEKSGVEVDEGSYSKFYLRMIIFSILKKYIDNNDQQRPLIILLDLPDACADDFNIFKLINIIRKMLEKNITILIAINSSNILIKLNSDLESLNFVMNNNVYHISKLEGLFTNIICLYSFLESKSDDFVIYKKNIQKIIYQEDIDNEVFYFKEYISQYFYQCLWFKNIILVEGLRSKINWIYQNEKIYIEITQSQKNLCFLTYLLLSIGIKFNFTLKLLNKRFESYLMMLMD